SFRLSQGTPAVAQRKAWARLVLAALLAVGATVWFVGLQVFAVQAVCPYCMVTHGSGFVAALLVLINAPLRLPPEKPWQLGQQVFLPPRAFKRAVLITLGALAGLVIGQLIHQPKGYRVTSIPAATPVEKAMSSNAAAVSATPVLAAA